MKKIIYLFLLFIPLNGMAQRMIDGLDVDTYFFTISKKSIEVLLEIQKDNPDTIIHYLSIVKKELENMNNEKHDESLYFQYINNSYFELLDGNPLLMNCKEVINESKNNNIKLIDKSINELNTNGTLSLEQKGDIYRLIFGYYNQKVFRNVWCYEYYFMFRDSIIRKLGKIVPDFKKQRKDKDDKIYLNTFEYEAKFHFLFDDGDQHLFEIEPKHIQEIKKALKNKRMFNRKYDLDVKVLQKMIEIAETEGDRVFFTISFE